MQPIIEAIQGLASLMSDSSSEIMPYFPKIAIVLSISCAILIKIAFNFIEKI